jgi:S-adenosyl methyltransferase
MAQSLAGKERRPSGTRPSSCALPSPCSTSDNVASPVRTADKSGRQNRTLACRMAGGLRCDPASAREPEGVSVTERSSPGSEDQQADIGVAHAARVYDYLLGGKDNFAADRMAGDELRQISPVFVTSVRAERAFLMRAVRYLVNEAGIRQFLDIGSGVPTANNTHEVAQSLAPECRIVYVDDDPVVLAHSLALLTSSPEGATAFVRADARDMGRIVEDAAMTLDFSKPVAIMIHRVLSSITNDEEAYATVNGLLGAVPDGSYLVIAHLSSEVSGVTSEEAIQLWTRTTKLPIKLRSKSEVSRFFQGLELVEPGIVSCSEWRSDPDKPNSPEVPVYGAVGRKIKGNEIREEPLSGPSASAAQIGGGGGRDEISGRLAEISSLTSGWLDGEGQAVSQRAVSLAFVVGEKLVESGVTSPGIYPTIEGGVLFEWSRGPWELSIEVEPDLSIHLVQVHVEAGTIIESTAEQSNLGEAIGTMNGMA